MAHEDRTTLELCCWVSPRQTRPKVTPVCPGSGYYLPRMGNKQLTDVGRGLDRYLRAVGVPPSLHGLFRGTLFSKKGLVIMQFKAYHLTLVFDTVTGRHKQVFVVDGRTRDIPTIGGICKHHSHARRTTTGGSGVSLDRPSNLPKGVLTSRPGSCWASSSATGRGREAWPWPACSPARGPQSPALVPSRQQHLST